MFDLGLSKIAVIGAVALIVLGPERLPKMARMAGALYGRAQRYMSDVKDEVSRDMALSELKEMGQSVEREFKQAADSVHDVANEVSTSMAAPTTAATIGKPYISSANRATRANWQLKTTRMPLWYKQKMGIKTHITSEAARMAQHRRYVAQLSKSQHSFFD